MEKFPYCNFVIFRGTGVHVTSEPLEIRLNGFLIPKGSTQLTHFISITICQGSILGEKK